MPKSKLRFRPNAGVTLMELMVGVGLTALAAVAISGVVQTLYKESGDVQQTACLNEFKAELKTLVTEGTRPVTLTDSSSKTDPWLATFDDLSSQHNTSVFQCGRFYQSASPASRYHATGECIGSTNPISSGNQKSTCNNCTGLSPAADSKGFLPIVVYRSGPNGDPDQVPTPQKLVFFDSTKTTNRQGLTYGQCKVCNFDTDRNCVVRVVISAKADCDFTRGIRDCTDPNFLVKFSIAETKPMNGRNLNIEPRRFEETYVARMPRRTGCFPKDLSALPCQGDVGASNPASQNFAVCSPPNYTCECVQKGAGSAVSYQYRCLPPGCTSKWPGTSGTSTTGTACPYL